MGECHIIGLNVNQILRELCPGWGNETAVLLPQTMPHNNGGIYGVYIMCQVCRLNIKTTCKQTLITLILQRRVLWPRKVMYVCNLSLAEVRLKARQWDCRASTPTPSTVRFLGCHLKTGTSLEPQSGRCCLSHLKLWELRGRTHLDWLISSPF